MSAGKTSQETWNAARTEKIFGRKKFLLGPHEHVSFWKTLGLIHESGAINSDQVKKLIQVNHMLTLLVPSLEKVQKSMPGKALTLVDVGCGKSYLSLALTYFMTKVSSEFASPVMIGFDTNAAVIESSRLACQALGLSEQLMFVADFASVDKVPGGRIHAVFALHACDTATDEALALGVKARADFVAVAPCCQAQLCQILSKKVEGAGAEAIEKRRAVLKAVLTSPQLLREASATWTDALRMSLLGAHGYEVVATEFVPSTHTPKNRLITGRRIQNHNAEKKQEFDSLKEVLGGPDLALEKLLLAENPI